MLNANIISKAAATNFFMTWSLNNVYFFATRLQIYAFFVTMYYWRILF